MNKLRCAPHGCFLVAAAVFCDLTATNSPAADQPSKAELQAATAAVQKIQESSGEALVAGRLDESIAMMLEAFPNASRSGVEAFILGNVLYAIDPKTSYALHKEAFEKLPDYPNAALEWAMEQHRAAEYPGALAAYDLYSKSAPNFAPVHGLAADCLIRLGRVPEACARWRKSEEATSGTIATFESLVCDIYQDRAFHRNRVKLRGQIEMGDSGAAARLIRQDGVFEHDWWNIEPHIPYLKEDVLLLKKLPGGLARDALECAGELLLAGDHEREAVSATLKKYGFLIDPKQTLPPDGDSLSVMLGAAIPANVLSVEGARKMFGPILIKRAEMSHDAELHNVLAVLYSKTPEMERIEKHAWEATGDVRFAAGYLLELAANKKLAVSNPDLVAAMKQFPENSTIIGLAIEFSTAPDQDLLVRAIKSEYRKFSPSGLYPSGVNLRPRATALRRYFAQLAKMQKNP